MGFWGILSTNQFWVKDYWCDSSINLPYKFHTPLGGKITVVTACVDIKFAIKQSGKIVVKDVKLSSKSFLGCGHKNNMASPRRGEAWFASNIRPKSLLFDLAYKELEVKNSRLKRIMFARYNKSKPLHKKLAAK